MNMDAVGGTRVRAGVRAWFAFAFGLASAFEGDFPFVDRRGRLPKEVPMGPCGRSSIVVAVGGRSH